MSSARSRPRLRTDRLILEPEHVGRFETWLAMQRKRDDPGYQVLSHDQAWQRLCARQGMWDAFGRGFYFLFDRQDGAMIGEAGLQFRRRDLGPEFDDHPEAAWAITKSRQGSGLASEAMRAILAEHERPAERIVALIAAANRPSLRLAARLGFETYADVVFNDHPSVLLARTTPPECSDLVDVHDPFQG